MAESSEQNNRNIAAESNGSGDDLDEFCKNFKFSNSTMCFHCDGFCGPNNNNLPVCRTCHTALFPSIAIRKRSHSTSDDSSTRPYKICRYRYDCDVGHLPSMPIAEPSTPSTLRTFYMDELSKRMGEPSTSSAWRGPLMLKDLNAFFGEVNQNRSNNNNNQTRVRIVRKSRTGKTHINDLPVEIMGEIFARLDENSLLAVGRVSKRWKRIVVMQQLKWKNWTERRWPLLERRTETTNWFKMYQALRTSCCCRICFKRMIEEAYNSTRRVMTRRGLRDIERVSETDGIRIIPINGNPRCLQATIVGPPGTPYEGGTFFLIIRLSHKYPYIRPTVKFVTKIIHPNISRHGDIGLDVLTWNYSMAMSLTTILLSIQSILGDPFTQECMEPELGRLYDNDRSRFDALARHWTKKYAMMNDIVFDN